jgi:hypothetical protein
VAALAPSSRQLLILRRMPKLSVYQENARTPHELTSPFPNRRKVKDPMATAVLAAAAVALLAFLIGMLGLLQIHGPR